MKSLIVTPEEFIAVRHSVLNGNTYNVGKLVEDTLNLEEYINGRAVIPCFEGDILQVRETGEVVLTHENFFPLSEKRYKNLKEKKLAASLKEVLDKIVGYRQQDSYQRIVLCFEPKNITSAKTIDETVRCLKEYGIEDAYFDSFFGGKLDLVAKANDKYETNYARSLHLIGNLRRVKLMMTQPREGYNILTIPHPISFSYVDEPVIYGAVGSTEILERIAEHPNVYGAYVRLKEGAGVKGALVKLWNSVTNTAKLRQNNISEYSIP